MNFQRKFRISSTLDAVRKFHQRSSSMSLITPPPVRVQMKFSPELLSEGDEMLFNLWIGPVRIPWRAKIENVSSNGFDDRMLLGPFESWIHQHQFNSIDESTVEVVDSIRASLRKEFFWKIIGWLMWINMPFLFAYRAWKTRRILQA